MAIVMGMKRLPNWRGNGVGTSFTKIDCSLEENMGMTKQYAKITAGLLAGMEKKERIHFLEGLPDKDRDKVVEALEEDGIKDNQK
jgi:hypothetical protein